MARVRAMMKVITRWKAKVRVRLRQGWRDGDRNSKGRARVMEGQG